MRLDHPHKQRAVGVLIVCLSLIVVGYVYWKRQQAPTPPPLPPPQAYVPEPTSAPDVLPVVTSSAPVVTPPAPIAPPPSSTTPRVPAQDEQVTSALPTEWRLAVPFLSQAPFGNWDMPYQEACEEASLLMVKAYYESVKLDRVDPTVGDRDLLAMIQWQTTRRDTSIVDISAEEAGQDAEAYWPELSASVVPVKTADDIRREIAAGRPVIIPAHGKSLANPHFRNGGPLYHMLVITGYLADGRFITNDPGTRFGKDFLYTEANLLTSIRDWNGGEVTSGEQVMLILAPKSR